MADCTHDYFWYPAANEEGWECCRCGHKPGEPPGFAPQLDRDLLDVKVNSILLDLHEGYFIGVSNSGDGEGLVGAVVERCKLLDRFDQSTICREIFEADNSHGDYWKEIAGGVLSGNDKRRRCHCGKLATVYTGDGAFCSEHYGLEAFMGAAK